MRQGLTYFHETIFPSLPVFYRRIDTALAQIGQPKLPLDHNLFRFGSWMGGDRDGGCPYRQPLMCCSCLIADRIAKPPALAAVPEQAMLGSFIATKHSHCITIVPLCKIWQCVTLTKA